MATNDSTNQAYTESDLISLGEKLAALELTKPERAALGDLISDDDVGGFGRFGIDLIGGIRKGFDLQQGRFGLRAGRHGVRAQGLRADLPGRGDVTKPGRF